MSNHDQNIYHDQSNTIHFHSWQKYSHDISEILWNHVKKVFCHSNISNCIFSVYTVALMTNVLSWQSESLFKKVSGGWKALHVCVRQPWAERARHTGTISLRAAEPSLCQCVNVASDTDQCVPWVPPHLCGRGRGRGYGETESSFITSARGWVLPSLLHLLAQPQVAVFGPREKKWQKGLCVKQILRW